MIHKYTLLKDLPDYKAGYSESHRDRTPQDINPISGCDRGKPWLMTLHEKSPDWVSKQIDTAYFADFTCPKCGRSDQMQISSESYRTWSDDVYTRRVKVYLNCACGGHKLLGDFYANSAAYNRHI